MNNKEWIREKLKENNYNTKPIYLMYDNFKKETEGGNNVLQSSFNRMIRRIRKECLKSNNINSEKIIKNDIDLSEYFKKYSKKDIIKMIENYAIESELPVSPSDIYIIAEKNNIPVEFINGILDVGKDLKEINKSIHYSIKDNSELNKLKTQNKLLRKESASQKNLIDNFHDKMDEIAEGFAKLKGIKVKPVNINKNNINSKKEAIILLSDFHSDEVVLKEHVGGLNEHNFQISKDRIDILFTKVIDYCRLLKIDIINLNFLGDFVSGLIHDASVNSTQSVGEILSELAEYLSEWITVLQKHIPVIKAIGLVGNHGRLTEKVSYKNKQTYNVEYIMYSMIKCLTKNVVQEFDLPKSPFLIKNIMGYNFYNFHGDTVRGGSGLNSAPGNLSRDIAKIESLFREYKEIPIYDDSGEAADTIDLSYFDIVNMGHFHIDNVIHAFTGARIIMNGCLIGANEYSINALKKGGTRGQVIYFVNEESPFNFMQLLTV